MLTTYCMQSRGCRMVLPLMLTLSAGLQVGSPGRRRRVSDFDAVQCMPQLLLRQRRCLSRSRIRLCTQPPEFSESAFASAPSASGVAGAHLRGDLCCWKGLPGDWGWTQSGGSSAGQLGAYRLPCQAPAQPQSCCLACLHAIERFLGIHRFVDCSQGQAFRSLMSLVQCAYSQAGRDNCLRRAKLPGSSGASSYKPLRGCSGAGAWVGRETCQPLWTHRLAPR